MFCGARGGNDGGHSATADECPLSGMQLVRVPDVQPPDSETTDVTLITGPRLSGLLQRSPGLSRAAAEGAQAIAIRSPDDSDAGAGYPRPANRVVASPRLLRRFRLESRWIVSE
jgi:hypothetical protein